MDAANCVIRDDLTFPSVSLPGCFGVVCGDIMVRGFSRRDALFLLPSFWLRPPSRVGKRRLRCHHDAGSLSKLLLRERGG